MLIYQLHTEELALVTERKFRLETPRNIEYIRAKYVEFPHDLEKASAKNFTPLSYQKYFSLRVFSACEGDIKLSFSMKTIA